MKLSTRGRYATRLMLELALNYKKGPLLLKEISKSQEISLKYLQQLIIPLKVAGLIKSSRGSHGGYFLSSNPENIRLSRIIVAVEGPLVLAECIENPDICKRSTDCVTKDIWTEISKSIFDEFDKYTLNDLVKRSSI